MPPENAPVCLILFSSESDSDKIAFRDKRYQEAYEKLYAVASQSGLKFYRSAVEWYREEEGKFSQAWWFENGTWTLGGSVKPDVLYDKSRFTPETQSVKEGLARVFPMINPPEFTQVLSSKYETSLLFPEYSKPYHLIADKDALLSSLNTLSGDLFAIKPERGSGGKDVVIGTKEELLQKVTGFPVLLQEFIDSSRGIPGITPGYHDLRLVFINDTLIYSYIRIPKEGSLLANVAQGGSMHIVSEKDLPASLTPLITAVQKSLARFPRKIYTIDLLFDEQARPWIVELNSKPGIYFAPGQEATRDIFFTALIQEFQAMLAS